MLKKELLMDNTGGEQPVGLIVGSYRVSGPYFYCGYDHGYYGRLVPIPFWGNYTYLGALWYNNQHNRTTCSMTDGSVDLTVYVSGYQDSPIRSEENIDGDIFELKEKVGQTVYLTFDPPPRRLFGSRNTRTNLGIGYYVEEAPWEAQNAEQGNASNFYTRTRSKDHSRGLSRRRRRRGYANRLQLYRLRLRPDSLCPITSPSSQRENSDVLHYPSKEYRGVVHWRNKRFRGHNSDSFGCRNNDRRVSWCPSTYSGQLHNQWTRVLVLLNEKEALYA